MDFKKLLSMADSNKAKSLSEASVKRYSAEMPPPKKVAKSNVQSSAIKQFLARKQNEEKQKVQEARQRKEELLAIRAQNSKNNKKAKIMASRTKDNDFSRIRLTDDEIEAKKKREAELLRLDLNNKVERMKARIELEEKEKLLPRKRKRKSKLTSENGNHDSGEDVDDCDFASSSKVQRNELSKLSGKNESRESKGNQKRPAKPPPQQALSFTDLLKVAAKKQYEPVKLPEVKEEIVDERPLSKKARRLLLEEENRIRRKMAANAQQKEDPAIDNMPSETAIKRLPKISMKKNVVHEREASQNNSKQNKKADRFEQRPERKPVVVHVRKDTRDNPLQMSSATPKMTERNVGSAPKKKPEATRQNTGRPPAKLNSTSVKDSDQRQRLQKHKESISQRHNSSSVSGNNITRGDQEDRKKLVKKVPEAKGVKPKVAPIPASAPQPSNQLSISEEMLAEIERRIRSQVQKEIAEKFTQHNMSASADKKSTVVSKSPSKKPKVVPSETPPFRTNNPLKQVSKNPLSSSSNERHNSKGSPLPSAKNERTANGKVPCHKPPPKILSQNHPPVAAKHESKQKVLPNKKLPPKSPFTSQKLSKPAFHPNPYLEPPRRLLESRRPQKPIQKRRLESDDEDDEDEEMNDFIDDGPQLDENEDYSRYIKEIFGYDRSRYIDDDDDDIIESTFAEQMTEEIRSEIIAWKEDLEEERKGSIVT